MWTSDVGESESRRVVQKPQKIRLKGIQKLEAILSLHRCRKTFFRFFLSLHRCRKTFFRFFLSLHRCRKTFFQFFSIASSVQENFFSVFSIASSVQENFLSVFSIASSVKKTLPYKIVSLYSIFFSKIVCRFNRYIFEYRCPSLFIGWR